MFSKPWILIIGLSVQAGGCSQAPHGAPSRLKVTNGIAAGNAFPAVVPLRWSYGGRRALCTATFVNSAQVVTAAHCVQKLVARGGEASDMYAEVAGPDGEARRVMATELNYFEDYDPQPGQLSVHDLAVVTFASGSAPATLPLYEGKPEVAQDFTIVGYGANDYAADGSGHTGSGIKRYGHNEIATLSGGFLEFQGLFSATSDSYTPGEMVSGGSGDSGGPLLIDGAIAGVDSGGNLLEDDGEVLKISKYVDLSDRANVAFLRRALVGDL